MLLSFPFFYVVISKGRTYMLLFSWAFLRFLKYSCFHEILGSSIPDYIFLRNLTKIILLLKNIRSLLRTSLTIYEDLEYYLHISLVYSEIESYKNLVLSKLGLMILYFPQISLSQELSQLARMHLFRYFSFTVLAWIFNYLVSCLSPRIRSKYIFCFRIVDSMMDTLLFSSYSSSAKYQFELERI